MANYSNLIAAIQATIYNNGQNLITGSALQGVLINMVQELGQAGAVFGGVVDRDFVPPTTDSNIFYIAAVPGTYSGFGQSVSVGEFAIFYFDGSDWAKASVTSAKVEVNTTSQTGVNLATISVGGQSYQIRAEKKDTTPTVGSSYAVTSNGVASAIATAVQNINNALALKADKTYVDNQLALKADKVAGAVNGNMAALDANGNIVDSGIASSAVGDVANKIDRVVGAGVGNVAMFDATGGIEDSEVPADNLAQQDGYYETLVAGASENLIGRGSVPANYTRRRSGGGSIGSGAAVLEEIQGNTLVWNQRILNGDFHDGTTNWSLTRATASVSDGIMTVTPTTTDNTSMAGAWMDRGSTVGHIYYRSVVLKGNAGLAMQWVGMGSGVNISGSDITGNWQRLSNIKNCTAADSYTRILQQVDASQRPFYIKSYFCVDMTAIFGAGNEPSTTAEFEALFPLNFYAYDAGSLLNLTATGLQTNGFNQWDEEWQNGFYNTSGGYQSNLLEICTKNFIPVFPGAVYYNSKYNNSGRILYYDADKNYTGYVNYYGQTFTIPSGCYYIKLNFGSTYGPTYNHDICINKSDTAYNGNYEPYWSETHTLPITTATSGGVAVFPDGEKSAGGKVDRYYKSQGSDLFDKAEKWIASRAYQAGDESDSTVKTDGTTTYYALSTPTDYTLDTPFSAQYRVDGMGTETLLPQNTATPTTSPINAEVKYPMNAVDTLRNLPQGYISKASMDAILTAFKTAGVITNYTLTWDATNQKYNCSITV